MKLPDTGRFVIADGTYAVAVVGGGLEPDALTRTEVRVLKAIFRRFPMADAVVFSFRQCDGEDCNGQIHRKVRIGLGVSVWDLVTLLRNIRPIRGAVATAYARSEGLGGAAVEVGRMHRSTRAYIKRFFAAIAECVADEPTTEPAEEPSQPVGATP